MVFELIRLQVGKAQPNSVHKSADVRKFVTMQRNREEMHDVDCLASISVKAKSHSDHAYEHSAPRGHSLLVAPFHIGGKLHAEQLVLQVCALCEELADVTVQSREALRVLVEPGEDRAAVADWIRGQEKPLGEDVVRAAVDAGQGSARRDVPTSLASGVLWELCEVQCAQVTVLVHCGLVCYCPRHVPGSGRIGLSEDVEETCVRRGVAASAAAVMAMWATVSASVLAKMASWNVWRARRWLCEAALSVRV